MSIAICICTCKRPESLSKTLEGLNQLHFTAPPPEVKLIVVDNDPQQSARQACERFRAHSRFPLSYYLESRPGIPHARNTCLQHAQDSDYIAFIDDDEIPAPNWLEQLLTDIVHFDAQIATGPVVRKFHTPPPSWIELGRFFSPPAYEEGTKLHEAFTGNVLFRTEIIKCMTPWFDERLAMTGGSDTHFFKRLNLAGQTIIWSADALVYENVPASRLTAQWLYQRSFRIGCTTTFIRFDLYSLPKAVFLTFVSFLYATIKGLGKVLTSLFSGKHRCIQGIRHLCFAGGLLSGLRGLSYHEYNTIHGQ